jgi:uncharacterized protein YaaN involved in tellurite resistance
MTQEYDNTARAGVENTEQQKTRVPPGTVTDGNQPINLEVPSAISKQGVYDSLTLEQKARADAAASKLNVSDALTIMDFASKEQGNLVTVAKKVAEKAKSVETQALMQSAGQLQEAYEKLQVGKLRPSQAKGILSAIFGKRAESIENFIKRQEGLSTVVDKVFAAQVEEEQQLREHYSAVQDLQEQNMQAFTDLTIQVAAAERALQKAYEGTAELQQRCKDSTDPQTIRQMRLALKGLEVLNHRVLTLKTARFEALNSTTIMDVQLEGLAALIGMIRNSHTVMRQVWENQISLAVTNAKMSKGAAMLSENREFMNKMMSANLEDLSSTAAAIQGEMQHGVIDIGVLEAVATRTIQLQKDIVSSSAQVQQGLQDQGRRVDALVEVITESTKSSGDVIKSLRDVSGDVPRIGSASQISQEN